MNPQSPEIPEALQRWIREEREYCFSTVPYGRPLQNAWLRAPAMIDARLGGLETPTPEQRAFIASVHASMQRPTEVIPIYQGIIDRCLHLVQAADASQGQDPILTVAVATLPTNERYAAVYQPHVAPDWRVIALDWGVISGLWSLSVAVAGVAPCANEDDVLSLPVQVDWLEQAGEQAVQSAGELVADAVVPCILMGTEPPIPALLGDTPGHALLAALIFNGLVFSIVAHEYAHVRRGHLAESNPTSWRRHQMEFEADGLALAYALSNPWRDSPLFHDASGLPAMMAVAGQCLGFSFISMLEMGDRMLRDLGRVRSSPQTHPPAAERLRATQYLLRNVLSLNQPTKQLVDAYRHRLLVVSEGLWNRSRRGIAQRLELHERNAEPPHPLRPRDADLRFS